MPRFTQDNHPFQLATPLGKDVLLGVGLHGEESISSLYQFTIDCVADIKDVQDNKIKFDAMVGEPISAVLELPDKKKRFFSGICQRISQSDSGTDFTAFQLQMVPVFWLLTKRKQSRIFQHKSVPDILREVFTGMKTEFSLQGTFEQRDYCVQYRESDFNFASRLMEEEGIYYYFKHEAAGETLLIGNTPGAHKELEPVSAITFKTYQQNSLHGEGAIESLMKSQEVISGKMTLFDHCFELPHKHLDAEKKTEKTINVGKVSTKVAPKVSTNLENYDFPGAYAQRFDGISKGGGEQPAEIQKIFTDNLRTVGIRADQEIALSVALRGISDCRQLASGFHCTIKTIASDKTVLPFQADGKYLLTSVSHTIEADNDFRSGSNRHFRYKNSFTCIPFDIAFRPQEVTEIPVIHGSQTAVVVGPPGEEIFTDKYGRVKVQFHWDRQGKNDADSSCWVRVGTTWAGRGWGMLHIPRIGQEVIVDFLEGDPDQPIIVGNVFNADQMPHYTLPTEKTKSYLKSNTSPGGVGFNEIRLEDKKGAEQIFIHAERNKDIRVKNDRFDITKNDQHWIVGTGSEKNESDIKGILYEQVMTDKHVTIRQHQQEHIGGDYTFMVGNGETGPGNMDVVIQKDHKTLVENDQHLHVKGGSKTLIDKDDHFHVVGAQFTLVDRDMHQKVKATYHLDVADEIQTKVDGGYLEKITNSKVVNAGQNILLDAGKNVFVGSGTETHIKAGQTLILEAGTQISLKVGGNFVDINASGVAINGTMVMINSGGAAGSGSGKKGVDADGATDAQQALDAKKAAPIKPTAADNGKTGKKSSA